MNLNTTINKNYTNIDLFSFRFLKDINTLLSYIHKDAVLDFLDLNLNYSSISKLLQEQGFTDEAIKKLTISQEDTLMLLDKYRITPTVLLILQDTLTDKTKADVDFFNSTLPNISAHRSNSIENLFIFGNKHKLNIINISKSIYHLNNIQDIQRTDLYNMFLDEVKYLVNNNVVDIEYILSIRDLGVRRISEYKNIYDSYSSSVNSIRSPKYVQGNDTYYSLPSITYVDSVQYSIMRPDYVYQIANDYFIDFITAKVDFINENYTKDLSNNDRFFLNNFLFTLDNAINKFIKDRVLYIENYINEIDIKDVNSRKDIINKMIYEVNPQIQKLLSITDIKYADNIIKKITSARYIIDNFIKENNLENLKDI